MAIDRDVLEGRLSELPIYTYFWADPAEIEFTDRVRHVCESDCSQYGTSWACPPGTGTVEQCKQHCLSYNRCLAVSTMTEVEDISSLAETLATRREHESITDIVASIVKELGGDPFVLSTESCAICERCAYLDSKPCRFPEKMHPCVESQGINIVPLMEKNGLEFQFGQNVVTWVSLILFSE